MTTTMLRDLLNQEQPSTPIWADAAHDTAWRLGADVASLVRWADQPDVDGWIVGDLVADDVQLQLRYEQNEPGSIRLQVRVTCPADPACRQAWDDVERRGELLQVVNGGLAVGDPECDLHDLQLD